MIGGVTRHILPHLLGVPHLHVNISLIVLRKCALGWRGCKIAYKGGLFFTPPKRLLHLPEVLHLHVNRP